VSDADRRVVLVTGGSRGLGKGIVADCLSAGHRVATFSRTETEFISQCRQEFDEDTFRWAPIDALQYDEVCQFANEVWQRWERMDVLVNNAAIGVDGLLPLMRPEDISRGLGINLESPVRLAQTCSRMMLFQRSGHIINISSINGIRGHKGVTVYSATKGALDAFTRGIARELGPRGIRANSVAPGYFVSDMAEALSEDVRNVIKRRTPLRRLGSVDDIVNVVRFLISDDSGFVTGQTISVDGGLGC
jgi:3-oxoacyl-[acyl-carrier protein] reductase